MHKLLEKKCVHTSCLAGVMRNPSRGHQQTPRCCGDTIVLEFCGAAELLGYFLFKMKDHSFLFTFILPCTSRVLVAQETSTTSTSRSSVCKQSFSWSSSPFSISIPMGRAQTHTVYKARGSHAHQDPKNWRNQNTDRRRTATVTKQRHK